MDDAAMGKGRGLVALSLMLAATIFASSPAQAQAQFDLNLAKRQAAESMRWIIVQILAKTSDGGGRQSGFGIIVGSRAGRITIATPQHLVWGYNEAGRYDDTPQVIFYDQPDLRLTARREKAFDSVADLAVVTVDAPRSISTKKVYTASIKATPLNAEVWDIGRAGQWLVSPTPGYYKGSVDASPFVQVDGLPAVPGSSGGAVTLGSNLFGMVTGDIGRAGQLAWVLPAETILAELNEWGFETNIIAGPTYEPVPYGAKLDCDRLPTSLRIANNIVSPVPVRGVTQWVTAPSDLYPHPQTRTALTLYGGQNTLTSNDQGAATLTDSVLGSASGTFVIRGNSIGFTSATLCGMGDLHGDMQSGLNVSTFQLWPMLCRAGVRFCSCNSGSIVQAKDLTIQETLVQCGGDAPSVRPPDQPYRQRSDLSGQTWAFFYQGRTVSLSFERSGRVLFSDPAWGSVAAWSSVGPEAIRIDANGEVFIGTLSLDGTAIDAKVYRGNNTQVQDQLTLKKVSATGP